MVNFKALKEAYKDILNRLFYKLNEEELYEKLKEDGILYDEGFIIKDPETEQEISRIPFNDTWIYLSAKADKKDLIMWITIFDKDMDVRCRHWINNELYNLLILKYKNIVNKEVFDLLLDNSDEFVEKIFKYKTTDKLLDALRKDMKFSNKNSWAGDPGRLILSETKYNEIGQLLNLNKEQLKIFNKKKKVIAEHIKYGDTQPASVVSIDPLIISCYNDEIDCVVMLKFPPELASKYNLKIGDRLITVNQYWPKMMFDYAPDLIPGENSSNQFRDVIPVVGLFVAENEGVCIRKVETIEISEWHKLQELTLKYLQEKPDTYRDGFRYFKTK